MLYTEIKIIKEIIDKGLTNKYQNLQIMNFISEIFQLYVKIQNKDISIIVINLSTIKFKFKLFL
jgi:hypothetical protein